MKSIHFSKGRQQLNSENTLTIFKNLHKKNWANFIQTWQKVSLGKFYFVEKNKCVELMDHIFVQGGIIEKKKKKAMYKQNFLKKSLFPQGHILISVKSFWASTKHVKLHPSTLFVYYSLNCTWNSSYKTLKENVIFMPALSKESSSILFLPLSVLPSEEYLAT